MSVLVAEKLVKMVGERAKDPSEPVLTLQGEIEQYEEEAATLTETKPPDEGTLEYYKWLALQEAMNKYESRIALRGDLGSS